MTQNVKAAAGDFGLLAYFPSAWQTAIPALLSYIATLARLLSFFKVALCFFLFFKLFYGLACL